MNARFEVRDEGHFFVRDNLRRSVVQRFGTSRDSRAEAERLAKKLNKEHRPVVEVEHIKIDRHGYAEGGRYWGTGPKLFRFHWQEDSPEYEHNPMASRYEISGWEKRNKMEELRAPDAAHAKSIFKSKIPFMWNAKFVKWGSVL